MSNEVAAAESVPKDEMAMVDSQKSDDTHQEPPVNDNVNETTTANAAVNNQETAGTGGGGGGGGGHDKHVSFNMSVTGSMKRNRLFGRQKPFHSVLGGGKPADVILWRNKQLSASMLAASTVIWLLFEWVGYHVLSFICNSLILSLAALFLWSNLSSFLNKSPPVFPELSLPEDVTMKVALLLRQYINKAFMVLTDVASKKDVKKFLYVILGLYVVSVVGSWFSFLTLVYIISVIVLTIPWLYEKNEDRVDDYAVKAKGKLKRQYDALDDKVLRKLPKMPSFRKDRKQD
ncbi:Reticulon-like protein B2 [Heracleum sosnowskyi]|uniref:Reticulon-like protein n=1 Tax=Heracleum sosnowskyi TaxID=360622 RepID=A0AAD8J548_9APIA|nr:Reticulon-like protein B2 [Heracleum sosnowskyi]